MASTPSASSHLQTWIDSSSVLPLLLPRKQRVVVVDGADLHLQVEVAADLLADRADDLQEEARAVLERAAVLVVAVVDRGAEELREQIAVRACSSTPSSAGSRARRAPSANCRTVSLISCCVIASHSEAVERVLWLVGGADGFIRFSTPGTSRWRPASG